MMIIKKLAKALLNVFGLTISRRQSSPPATSNSDYINDAMYHALERVNALGLDIKTILDVGAAAGTWTMAARRFWKESIFVLVEPLHERKAQLEAFVKKYPNTYFVPAAAGKEKSEIQFYVSDDLDGSGVATGATKDEHVRTVAVTSLDIEVKRLKAPGPYMVKLDTHGFEIPILEGCTMIWNDVSLFIIECYGFQIAKDSLLFWEMCKYMDGLGFRLFDIVDVMHRQKDNAFWQCDAFFIRKDNAVFQNNSYA